MKKIQSALIGLLLVPGLLTLSNRMTAQDNPTSVHCETSLLQVVQGVEQNRCFYEVTVNLNYSQLNTDPRACPHGIQVTFDNATVISTAVLQGNVWFNSATKSVSTNLREVCWSRVCNWNASPVSARFANVLQPGTVYKVKIYVQPIVSTAATEVHLKTLQGYAWIPGAGPNCNVYDCFRDFTYKRPDSNYTISCVKPVVCDLCPPVTPGDQVLQLNPTPPAYSTIVWYKSSLPCPSTSPPTGWTYVNTVYQNPPPNLKAITCPTAILPESTCWIAVITTGCFSYVSTAKTIYVCRPNSGIVITPASNNPPPIIQINQEWHACSPWAGTLSIPSPGIVCPTTIRWEYWNGSNWTLRQTGLYDPLTPNPALLACPTGTLQYLPFNPDVCDTVYRFRVRLINNICPPVTSVIDIHIDKPTVAGAITAAPDLVGSGNQIGPVFCETGYTSLSYSGLCTKVNKWQISESTDPCGMGTTWGPWNDIMGASSGDNTSYFTNILHKTFRYRTQVQNYACDPVFSNPIVVTVIPALSVTLTANSPCPDICNGPVLLTANVPCSTAYTSLAYSWYKDEVLIPSATGSTYTPNQGGVYYVVVTSQDCGSKQSDRITVCGALSVSITGPCAICAGQTAILQAVVSDCSCRTVSYLWSNGATTPSITVTTPGFYAVSVSSGSCLFSASFNLVQCPSTTFSCGNSFTDVRDGHVYNSVQIGTQCWMKENLAIGTQINGGVQQTDNGNIEKYCYDNIAANCTTYGGLYQWGEVVQYYNGASNTTSWNPAPAGNLQGICPTGWHLPTNADWTVLTTFEGGTTVAGGPLKEAGTAHWTTPNTGATNTSDFTALGGGEWYVAPSGFMWIKGIAVFYSASQSNAANASAVTLYYNSAVTNLGSGTKEYGFSVRCLKDPAVASSGTLNGAPNNCSPATINGVYLAGTVLTGSNTVDVQANVTAAGTYTISTNSINGISFSKSGTFSSTGVHTVNLTGTGTPAAAGTYTYSVTYGTSSCTFDIAVGLTQTICGTQYTYYEVTNPLTGKKWFDRNLGAIQVAQSSTDYLAYGALYQWGRLSDDHQCINWTSSTTGAPVNGITYGLSATDIPGHALFINATGSPYDWRDPANNNLWQGPSGINNPCPTGYRIPTNQELEDERATWGSQDAAGAFASPMKFVVAGSRNTYNFGALFSTGSWGYVMSSTISGNYITALSFGAIAQPTQSSRANGASVRCIKN